MKKYWAVAALGLALAGCAAPEAKIGPAQDSAVLAAVRGGTDVGQGVTDAEIKAEAHRLCDNGFIGKDAEAGQKMIAYQDITDHLDLSTPREWDVLIKAARANYCP